MNTITHKAGSRGHANHGWLDSWHSFSFANYYNPEKIHFGALRVLNDDTVAGDKGFGMHPHDNMEIISIPLKGALAHKDNAGHSGIIYPGDVQVMSAGKGIFHSEFNHDATQPVNFLQIWVFPDRKNVEPRYDQQHFDEAGRKGRWQQIISPDANDEGCWIYQQAWFYRGEFEGGKEARYSLKNKENGIYLFVIEGSIRCNNTLLERRDAMAITGTEEISLTPAAPVDLLLMEMPLRA